MWCRENSRCITPRYVTCGSFWQTWEGSDELSAWAPLPVPDTSSTAPASCPTRPTTAGWTTWDNLGQATALWGFPTWDRRTVEHMCSTSSPATRSRRCRSKREYSCWWQVGRYHSDPQHYSRTQHAQRHHGFLQTWGWTATWQKQLNDWIMGPNAAQRFAQIAALMQIY